MLLSHPKRSKNPPHFQVDFEHLMKGFFCNSQAEFPKLHKTSRAELWLHLCLAAQRALGDISGRSVQAEMLGGPCACLMLQSFI